MIDVLALTLTMVCMATAGVVTVQAARTSFRRNRCGRTLAVVQTGLVVQAVFDVVGLLGGQSPRELATHLAYLVMSVVLLPMAMSQTRGDDGRWSAALLAVVLVVVAVLVIRLATTWRPADG